MTILKMMRIMIMRTMCQHEHEHFDEEDLGNEDEYDKKYLKARMQQ